MIVRQTLAEAPPIPRSLAIGSFDGVHLGHQRVIRRAVEAARERGISSAVVTFTPHPASVVRPELAPPELSSLARQASLVEELGPDELVLIRFTPSFAQLDHEQFAREVVADTLRAADVVVGTNFRFGHGARGTPELLADEGRRFGFEVEAVPLLEIGGNPVSSSRIRRLIGTGQVEAAAELLGRPPWLEGAVVRGDGRGRGLGFATANLAPLPRSALPGRGVYAGFAHLPGIDRPAAISVGSNPTFSDDATRHRIEAHLLDFDADVYGSPIRLELTRRLRDEERYDSVDELVAQVRRDIDAVRGLEAATAESG